MKVTFRGRTLTEITQRAGIISSQLLPIGITGRLRNLRRQRRADGHKMKLATAVVNRHLAAFTEVLNIAKQLIHKLLSGEATVAQCQLLAILRHHHIVRIKRGNGSGDRCLFTGAGKIKAQPPLTLCTDHAFVEETGVNHIGIDFFCQFRGHRGHGGARSQLTISLKLGQCGNG